MLKHSPNYIMLNHVKNTPLVIWEHWIIIIQCFQIKMMEELSESPALILSPVLILNTNTLVVQLGK